MSLLHTRYSQDSLEPPPEAPLSVLSDLITTKHILHHQEIVDSFGHVSVRHPNDSNIYIMAGAAANTVSSASDLFYYRVNDSTPLPFPNGTLVANESARSERFNHGGTLRRYSEINSIVHGHALPILPYATSDIALLPVYHQARFLGLYVPNWDITPLYNDTEEQDMLVDNVRFADSLALAFSNSTNTNADYKESPDYLLVLQRYHGFSTVGTSLKNSVFQAIYATNNAVAETEQLELRRAKYGDQVGELEVIGLNERQVTRDPGDWIERGWYGLKYEVDRLPQYVDEIAV